MKLIINITLAEFNPQFHPEVFRVFRVRLTNEETDISTILKTFPTFDAATRYAETVSEITGAAIEANQPV